MATTYSPYFDLINSCAVYYDFFNARSYIELGYIDTLVGSVSGVLIQPPPTFSTEKGGVLVLGGVSAADGTIGGTYPRRFPTNDTFAHTLEIVISPSGTPALTEAILMLGTGVTNNHVISRSTSNVLQIQPFGSAAIHTHQMTNGSWYHVVSTYDGTTSILYVNGVRISSVSATIVAATKGIYLFGNITGYDDFEGKVGIVRMYNKCLNAEEAFATFTSIRGRYGI